jgi:hypothetical protein
MDLFDVIQNGGSIKLEVTGADLLQFANTLIERAKEVYRVDSMPVIDGEETWLTTEEAAQFCKVSKTTLWSWQKAGYLVPSKLGKKKCYALSEINKILHTKVGG